MNPQKEHTAKPVEGDRAERIQALVDDYLRRRSLGEPVEEDEVVAGRPDLMPELGVQLQRAHCIMNAARDTNHKSVAESETSPAQSSAAVVSALPLHIRCPHCHSPIDILSDSPFTNITCSRCGSTFSIVDRHEESAERPPLKSVGHFDLIERLGMGAFATVWRAQDVELDREVAIKIPRRGMLDPLQEEQFLREARVAAQLRHRNIVSVHEVGRHDDTLYIVSNLVRGVNLAEWLSENTPTFQKTAQLCHQIADALHHAHEAGVVHRDLKPSNIMMDADGVPHLMDFGLARRVAGEVTMTANGNVLGTPTHMSPEQARGEGHTADRRTDIYSLGVILYQLLAGELPFRGNAKMLLYQVLHDDPPSPRRLNNQVPRDLETICLKCLEKDPDRRYATAAALADDLGCFLSNQPIRAVPPSAMYRFRKFAVRHKLPVTLASLLFLMVSATAVIATLMSLGLARQRERAVAARQHETDARQSSEEVVDFLIGLFEMGDPSAAGKTTPSVVDIVKNGADRLENELVDQPLVRARLQTTLGTVYCELSEFERAEELLRQSLAARERLLGNDHKDVAETLTALAEVYQHSERYDEGYDLLLRALAIRRRDVDHADSSVAEALDALAANRFYAGDSEQAVEHFRQVVALMRQRLGSNDLEVVKAQANLGAALQRWGHLEEAESLLRQVLADQQRLLGDHIETAHTLDKLTHVMFSKKDSAQAEQFAIARVDLMRRVVHESHPDLLHALHNYAYILIRYHGPEQAVPVYREIVSKQRASLGNEHEDVATSLNDLGMALTGMDWGEAEVHLVEALRIRRKLYDNTSISIARSAWNLGFVYHSTDRPKQAEPLYLECFGILDANHPEYYVRTQVVEALVRLFEEAGRSEEAQEWQAKLNEIDN